MKMGEIDIHDYARQVLEAHGEMAVVEAAQKARRGRNVERYRSSLEANARAARKLRAASRPKATFRLVTLATIRPLRHDGSRRTLQSCPSY
jgi:hypothetical protein